MTTTPIEDSTGTILDSIRGTRDALSVRRVFGDPYELNGTTVIPVARVAGGAGGGAGEGPDSGKTGQGFGTGFGLGATPIGVYEIRDGHTTWKPVADVTQLVKGFQVLAGIIAICVTLIARRKRPDTR
ncbi:MAG: spore germination protein GerW family protein [Acidimicrobiales bacterium]